MTVNDDRRIMMALGILSGRIKFSSLDGEDWDLLGYNSYSFSSLGGPPDESCVKLKAEEIIFEALKS